MYNTTCPQFLEKIFVDVLTSTLLRAQNSCQKYDEDFFKFCGLLRKLVLLRYGTIRLKGKTIHMECHTYLILSFIFFRFNLMPLDFVKTQLFRDPIISCLQFSKQIGVESRKFNQDSRPGCNLEPGLFGYDSVLFLS